MQHKPHFVVVLADLERGPKRVRWEIDEHWLRWAFDGTDATPSAEPGELRVELSKNGREVMVRGDAKATVNLPCARTMDPVPVELSAEVFLMLAPSAPAEAPRRRKGQRERGLPVHHSREAPARPGPRTEPRRRAGAWETTPELSDQEAARDTFQGEQIVLDDFVREFLLLELPMVVVRSDLPADTDGAYGPRPPDLGTERPIDPRLMPLIAIKSRLSNPKE